MTVQSSKAFFDALAAKREHDARRHRAYYADRVRWLSWLIPRHASVADLGCGVGITLRGLPQRQKTGIDFAEEMLKRAKEKDTTSTYLLDHLEKLSHEQPYDYVLLMDTINYLRDIQACLGNVRAKLCHDRTRVVITYYNFLWQPLFLVGQRLGVKTWFPEQNWLNRSDIDNLLQMCGFETIQTGSRILCPLPIPLLEPLCNRFLVSLPLLRSLALVRYIIARPVPERRKDYSVTVLSAVRNERGNIARIADAMPAMGTETELLFIEGHSTDGTWEEIERIVAAQNRPVRVRGLRQTGKGKANALHEGMAQSAGDLVILYDGDFTMHPHDLPKLYDVLAEGRAEFVNASRAVYPMREGAMRLLNLIGNKAFSALFTWLFSQHLRDVLSPVKAMFRHDYPAVTTRMDPFGDFDFFLGAARLQLKMREVPVRYLERTYGTTKIRRFHHGWLLLKMCFKGATMLRWQ